MAAEVDPANDKRGMGSRRANPCRALCRTLGKECVRARERGVAQLTTAYDIVDDSQTLQTEMSCRTKWRGSRSSLGNGKDQANRQFKFVLGAEGPMVFQGSPGPLETLRACGALREIHTIRNRFPGPGPAQRGNATVLAVPGIGQADGSRLWPTGDRHERRPDHA